MRSREKGCVCVCATREMVGGGGGGDELPRAQLRRIMKRALVEHAAKGKTNGKTTVKRNKKMKMNDTAAAAATSTGGQEERAGAEKQETSTDVHVSREAAVAISEAATIFLHFIAANATWTCKEKKRSTMKLEDVYAALEDTGFAQLANDIKEEEEEQRRKIEERQKQQQQHEQVMQMEEREGDEQDGDAVATPTTPMPNVNENAEVRIHTSQDDTQGGGEHVEDGDAEHKAGVAADDEEERADEEEHADDDSAPPHPHVAAVDDHEKDEKDDASGRSKEM